jgi:hypothetical protein
VLAEEALERYLLLRQAFAPAFRNLDYTDHTMNELISNGYIFTMLQNVILIIYNFRIQIVQRGERPAIISKTETKLNSVALVRERTIPTELPPLVGEIVPTFADRGCCVVSATIPTVVNLGFLDRSRYCFLPSSSSVVRTRLGGPRSRLTASQKIWKRRESPETLTTRPQRRSLWNE